jgi:hypothetical protein
MSTFTAKEGDIGWGYFSLNEDRVAHQSRVPHPVLVLEERSYGCVVAYGTSQVSAAPLPHEWVLSEKEARLVGLTKPTMFVLTRREMTTKHLNDRKAWAWGGGSFPIKGNVVSLPREAQRRLYKACQAAGLV